jgi:hypothetical protein
MNAWRCDVLILRRPVVVSRPSLTARIWPSIKYRQGMARRCRSPFVCFSGRVCWKKLACKEYCHASYEVNWRSIWKNKGAERESRTAGRKGVLPDTRI